MSIKFEKKWATAVDAGKHDNIEQVDDKIDEDIQAFISEFDTPIAQVPQLQTQVPQPQPQVSQPRPQQSQPVSEPVVKLAKQSIFKSPSGYPAANVAPSEQQSTDYITYLKWGAGIIGTLLILRNK
jgi:hypothetical protein